MKRKNFIALLLALALLVTGCANTERDWQEQYDLGMRYLAEGDYEEAILAFSAAIDIDDSRPEAYMGRAEAYIAVNEPDKALKDYKKARRLAKNDDEYEDLAEELEDIIEMLEEETGERNEETENQDVDREAETEERNEETENQDDDREAEEAFQITVTDAYALQYTNQYGIECCCHIPRINLTNDLAAEVNAQIYDDIYDYAEREYGNICYDWKMMGDLLSVVVQLDYSDWAWTEYYVYTISVETGEQISQDEVLAAYGLDWDSYYALARSTLERQFDFYSAEMIQNMGESVYNYILTSTLSEDNLRKTVPYIGENGDLCMVAAKYSPAGADYYLGLYNLLTQMSVKYLDCRGDHSAPAAAYTAGEITQMVADWYNNNVGGYESGTHVAFDSETTVSDGKCFVVVRFQNSDPNYTGGANVLVTVAEVDMTTGEMWSDGYFRGYLWGQ